MLPPFSALPSPPQDADLIVVGGGLSGLPLAIACARAGVRIVVIDRAAPDLMQAAPFDGRTTAISYTSQQILAAIGVWDHLAQDAEPILDIRVADCGSRLFLHYDHREVGDHPFGWIVENRLFRRALFAAADGLATLTHLAPCGVTAVDQTAEAAIVTLTDGRTLRARLVAAADGKNSALRQQAGIRTIGQDYGQHAIICTVAHERPHHGVAVEHFLPAGPFAILPLSDNRCSVVWSEQAARAPSLLALPDPQFEAEVAARFGDWLGPLRVIGPRGSYPLEVMLAERLVAPRLALVADAGHVIHPIAGQGLNLGLRDVALLAELVVDACRLGLDPGASSLLERYDRGRRADTLALAAATDGLNRLFSNDLAPLRLARSLGLAAVNRMPPLRRFFMRHAMGMVGDQPRLVRGEAL